MLTRTDAAAYGLGVQLAIEQFGKQAAESKLPGWLPAAGAAGLAGLGAYGLARFPFLANKLKYPALRKIQDLSKGEMRHVAFGDKPGWLRRKIYELVHGPAVWEGELGSMAGKAKQRGGPLAVWGREGKMPAPGTFDPALGPAVTRAEQTQALRRIRALEDKLHEAGVLAKRAPGAGARTLSAEALMKKYKLQLRPDHLGEDLKALQEAGKKEFGKGFLVKSRKARAGGDVGSVSGGSFLSESGDWAREHANWLKIKPGFRKLVDDPKVLDQMGLGKIVRQFRGKPGYRGRLVEEMMNRNAIFQAKMPLQRTGKIRSKLLNKFDLPTTKEFRVHTIGGKPVFSVSRGAPALGAGDAAKWFEQDVLSKMPAKYRNLSYGADIAKLEDGAFKVVELNPGGQSGMWDVPGGYHLMHKAMTGRHTRPVAALAGLGAGGLAGGATAALTEPKK